jgi:hypothetical protein
MAIDPAARVRCEQTDLSTDLLVAEGLALRLLISGSTGTNLLVTAENGRKELTGRELVRSFVLACIIMVGLLVALLGERAALRSEQARLEQQIHAMVRQALPGQHARSFGPLLARMVDQRLKDLESASQWHKDRLLVLVLLERIARSKADMDGIMIDRIALGSDKVAIQGRAVTPEQVDQWCQRIGSMAPIGGLEVQKGQADQQVVFAITGSLKVKSHEGI